MVMGRSVTPPFYSPSPRPVKNLVDARCTSHTLPPMTRKARPHLRKSSTFVVRVHPRLHAKVRKAASRWKVTTSEAVRELLEGAIQKWAGK